MTASENTPMIRVNTRLGNQVVHTLARIESDVSALDVLLNRAV
jgi:hypothetical protein